MSTNPPPSAGGWAWFSGPLLDVLTGFTAVIRANTQALTAHSVLVQQLIDKETLLMADLTALTAQAANLASEEGTLAAAVTALEAAYQAAKAGGFTAQNQLDLDAAVASLNATQTKIAADAAAAIV